MIVLQAGAILLVPCRRSRMAALETPRTDRRVFGFSIGILLFAVTFVINLLADFFVRGKGASR